MTVRPMRSEDLPAVAVIHRAAYTDDHTTAHLSPRLLHELYRHLLALNSDFCFVAVTDRPVGFVVGGLRVAEARSRFIRTNRLALGLRSLRNLNLARAALSMARRRIRRKAVSTAPGVPTVSLLSIAVEPAAHRSGVGRRLLENFAQCVGHAGFTHYTTSVRATNTASSRLFLSAGAQVAYSKAGSVHYRVPAGGRLKVNLG